jgi:hypothetical protein
LTTRYFTVEPDVAAGWGEHTVFTRAPGKRTVVHKLHYQFDGWLGDELLETSPCFIVSERIARKIELAQLRGARFEEAKLKSQFPSSSRNSTRVANCRGLLGFRLREHPSMMTLASHRILSSSYRSAHSKCFVREFNTRRRSRHLINSNQDVRWSTDFAEAVCCAPDGSASLAGVRAFGRMSFHGRGGVFDNSPGLLALGKNVPSKPSLSPRGGDGTTGNGCELCCSLWAKRQ